MYNDVYDCQTFKRYLYNLCLSIYGDYLNDKFFNDIVADSVNEITDRLTRKGNEYSDKSNRFSQIIWASELSGLDLVSVVWGYTLKHIAKMNEKIANGTLTSDDVLESGFDIASYMIVIRGLVIEMAKTEGDL